MNREEIKSTRTLLKLSQAALARLTKLTPSEISRIECGYRDVSEEEAAAIASALGLTNKAVAKKSTEQKNVTTPVPQKTLASEMTPSAPTPPPANNAAVSKPAPTGSDLSDAVNFGVLPDLALLVPGALDEAAFRARLAKEISRANTILHTPRVPAAVWRAWRQFEQQATERLRSGAPSTPAVPAPVPVRVPVASERLEPVAASAESDKSESKSFNSLFVEAARAVLPAERVEQLNRAAETARHEDQTTGFMKHFRRIAESELEPALLKQVTEDANQRQANPERWRTRRGRGNSSAAAK